MLLTVSAPTPILDVPLRSRNLLLRAAVAGLLTGSLAACSSAREAEPARGRITSTESVGMLSEDEFKAMCDEAGGTVEALAHCGGLATGPGFAYDSTDGTLSRHTCAGANTCGGWNCLTDE
jgi:hypothetical protein